MPGCSITSSAYNAWSWPARISHHKDQAIGRTELFVAHHEQVGRRSRKDGRVVKTPCPHRLPTKGLARSELLLHAATAFFERSRGDDQELVAETTFMRQDRAGREAHLIDEGKQPPQLRVGEARELAGRAQHPQPVPIVHRVSSVASGMRPSPTPPEKARWMSGVTRFRSLSAPELSP